MLETNSSTSDRYPKLADAKFSTCLPQDEPTARCSSLRSNHHFLLSFGHGCSVQVPLPFGCGYSGSSAGPGSKGCSQTNLYSHPSLVSDPSSWSTLYGLWQHRELSRQVLREFSACTCVEAYMVNPVDESLLSSSRSPWSAYCTHFSSDTVATKPAPASLPAVRLREPSQAKVGHIREGKTTSSLTVFQPRLPIRSLLHPYPPLGLRFL